MAMRTEFISADQEQAYGHYVGSPTTQQLAAYFHLDNADRKLIRVGSAGRMAGV
jgi:hypothetical protein